MALETKVMTKGELRRFLMLLGAKQRQQGFQLAILPVVEGDVEEETDAPVLRGERIVPRALRL